MKEMISRNGCRFVSSVVIAALIFVFGVAIAGEVSASEKPQYGGTLSITTRNIKEFDPTKTATYKTQTNVSFMYEPLVNGDIEKSHREGGWPWVTASWLPLKFTKGCLAESWEWLDKTTLVFHLRKGVKFQNLPPVNGREFVADDVVYTFNRLFASKRLDHYVHNHVESVTAKDKYTVIFKLKKPYSQAVVQLGLGLNHFIFPREVVEKYGDLSNWKHAVGTGPYILKDFVPANRLTFKKNPNYWDKGKPYVDEIKALIFGDEEAMLAAFRSGKVDIIADIQPMKMPSLKKANPEIQFTKGPMSLFTIYMRVDQEPFSDIRVRKALSMAIDRKAIAEKYWAGEAETFSFPYPPAWGKTYHTPLDAWPEAAEIYSYNPEKAKELLKEAGYPNGFKTKLTYTMGYGRVYSDQMEVVKHYWSRIGVEAELVVKEYAAYYSTTHKGKYDGMGGGLHGQGGPLLMSRYYLPGSTMNKYHVDDPKFTAIVDELKAAYDPVEFNALARKMNKYAVEQVWSIPMPQSYQYIVWHPWVKNYNGEVVAGIYDRGHAFTNVWIDQALRKKMLKK